MTITDISDQQLKARHRTLWASGDYPAVAELIGSLGRRLVEAVPISAGPRVIDVAAGAGNVAIAAADAGAHVVATDLVPELLAVGESSAGDRSIVWRTADAEDLPFAEGEFDCAVSCVGVMFAPHYERCAVELIRVTRSGGRIGLINWTPAGFIGQLFSVLKPYAPPPLPGAQPGVLWGDVDHVRALFGERVTDVEARTESVTIDRFDDGAAFRDFFKAHYGPMVATYRGLADDSTRTAALDAAIAELADEHITDGTMQWEYLLVTATVV
ncbi:class I SAM-dependent methyltransferase [Gordonia sp. CPCC 205515]|uniref:class I SAM-dependent methyltransferase n=1 Tax=Gordonia sp. CPCC 205515 TaxID=3140791 RepID=UPI003AF3918A